MEALTQEQGRFRLRKVDIAKWGSPVAQQHGINRLPQLWLYDGEKLVSKDKKAVMKKLRSGG